MEKGGCINWWLELSFQLVGVLPVCTGIGLIDNGRIVLGSVLILLGLRLTLLEKDKYNVRAKEEGEAD